MAERLNGAHVEPILEDSASARFTIPTEQEVDASLEKFGEMLADEYDRAGRDVSPMSGETLHAIINK